MTKRKSTKWQTTICKTLHRKLKIEQPGVNWSCKCCWLRCVCWLRPVGFNLLFLIEYRIMLRDLSNSKYGTAVNRKTAKVLIVFTNCNDNVNNHYTVARVPNCNRQIIARDKHIYMTSYFPGPKPRSQWNDEVMHVFSRCA